MEKMKVSYSRRTVMMLTGILFISLCVGCYRLSNFGVDAFTCMNLGISGFLHMSFGTWQLIMNAVILVVVFFTVRKNIGAGTIINMVCVGYGADFICWIVEDMLKVEAGLPLRILFKDFVPCIRLSVCRAGRSFLHRGRYGDCAL